MERKRIMEQQAGKHPEKSKKYVVRVDEMILAEKIRYFHPLFQATGSFGDLNTCYNEIKELLVSNDGKYLFACI